MLLVLPLLPAPVGVGNLNLLVLLILLLLPGPVGVENLNDFAAVARTSWDCKCELVGVVACSVDVVGSSRGAVRSVSLLTGFGGFRAEEIHLMDKSSGVQWRKPSYNFALESLALFSKFSYYSGTPFGG